MGVNSLPKTVTRQCRGCDLNPGPSALESSMLTTRLPSHPMQSIDAAYWLSTDVAWSVCLLVTAVSCAKNGRTSRDAVWGVDKVIR